MNKLKKAFLSQKMSWLKVIIFAIITAIITAVLNIIPIFKDTSFQDIAINLECWILFAMFIIVNCEKFWEASLKTFVFFLISQPLIYLIEVPFSPEGFGIFTYYKYWFLITLLTLPGAAFAFLVKKNGIWGLFPLTVINVLLSFTGIKYFWSLTSNFPYHLLSCIFCFALILFFIFTLTSGKTVRIILSAVSVIIIAVCVAVTKPTADYTVFLPTDSTWSCEIENESIVSVSPSENGGYNLKAKKKGSSYVTFTNPDGEIKEFYVTVSGGSIAVNEFE